MLFMLDGWEMRSYARTPPLQKNPLWAIHLTPCSCSYNFTAIDYELVHVFGDKKLSQTNVPHIYPHKNPKLFCIPEITIYGWFDIKINHKQLQWNGLEWTNYYTRTPTWWRPHGRLSNFHPTLWESPPPSPPWTICLYGLGNIGSTRVGIQSPY